MKNRKLSVMFLVCLLWMLAGCGGKFMKTQSEDLAPFADQTISMVADIAGGVEKARTITVQQMIDWEDPEVKQYARLRGEINQLFRAIIIYSLDIVTISEADKSGEEKCAALAEYLESIEEPLKEQRDVEIRLTPEEFNQMLTNIRAQDKLLDGLVEAQPLINEVARYGNEILELMRFRVISIDKQLSAAIEARFGYLDALGVSFEEELRLLTEARGYAMAYKKGDRKALDKLRQMQVIGVKEIMPPGRLSWKQIDKIDQFILSRLVSVQKVMKEHDFSFQVYVDTQQELSNIMGNRMASIATGRLFLFTWARAHSKMAAGKVNPAKWFDIAEAPGRILAAGAKAVF